MKGFERIFLYSVLAILVFYVFLVDGNVESQVVIQEEIRARSVVIVNDAGQELIKLNTNKNGGVIRVYNKAGNDHVGITIDDDGFGMIITYDKNGFHVY
ncbi:hypothetical protein ES708_23438 [subsurface metagenome]